MRRRVNLYFDENDEMIEKEESEEEQEESAKNEAGLDDVDLQKKLLKVKSMQMINSRTKITVNIGDADYDYGKNQITKEIFDGRDKTENAEMFIENLIKTRKHFGNTERLHTEECGYDMDTRSSVSQQDMKKPSQ